MIKNITDFVKSENYAREELQGVYITPDRIVATDSYKLVEQKLETGATEPIIVKLPKGVKSFDFVAKKTDRLAEIKVLGKNATYEGEIINATFPDYEKIFPTEPPIATIKLNAKYLQQVATAFVGADAFNSVIIEIHEPNRPLVFTNETAKVRSDAIPDAKLAE